MKFRGPEIDPNELSGVDRELRQAIAELSLVSHAPTQALGQHARSADEEPGGRRPAGSDVEPRPKDDDERKAWEESYHRKTPAWFGARRANALGREDAARRLQALRDDCLACVEAWRKTPPPPRGVELERFSFAWKCKVADDDSGTIKQREDRYDIDRSTIYRYRAQYRGLQRKRA